MKLEDSPIVRELREILNKAEQEGSFHAKPIGSLTGSFNSESLTSPEESKSRPGPVEATMIADGVPVTRENWINLAYLGHPPEEWSQELENELPRHLQDPDWYKKVNR